MINLSSLQEFYTPSLQSSHCQDCDYSALTQKTDLLARSSFDSKETSTPSLQDLIELLQPEAEEIEAALELKDGAESTEDGEIPPLSDLSS